MIQRLNCELGVAMVDVPTDGNCLPWSLLFLSGGRDVLSEDQYRQKKTFNTQMLMRRSLKASWESLAAEPMWQKLFRLFHGSEPGSCTPTGRRKKAKADKVDDADMGCVDLVTPPSPKNVTPPRPQNQGKKRSGAWRAEDQRGVPLCNPKTASPTLKSKEQQQTERVLEPPVPDLAEHLEKLRQVAPKDEIPAVEDIAWEMPNDEDVDASRHKNKKARHQRTCKIKEATENSRLEGIVKSLLAEHGATYGLFQSIHCKCGVIRKAGVCSQGGFVNLQIRLRQNQETTCAGCLEFMRVTKISSDLVSSTISSAGSHAPKRVAEAEKEEEDDSESANPEKILERCISFVKTYEPDIELLIEGNDAEPFLRYRCRICATKAQPKGRINILGKPHYKSVVHFLTQHLSCFTHMCRKRQKDLESMPPEPASKRVPCSGFFVFALNISFDSLSMS